MEYKQKKERKESGVNDGWLDKFRVVQGNMDGIQMMLYCPAIVKKKKKRTVMIASCLAN